MQGLFDNSSCTHFFTLPEDPVMVRKIEPRRAQRDTESCYFSLSPPLCPLRFSEPNSENIKKSPGFWSLQREMSETQCKIMARCAKVEPISFKYHSNTNYNYMGQYDSHRGLTRSLSTYHSELAEAHVQKAGFTAIH